MATHNITTGKPGERELTLSGKLYFPEIFKGMLYSIKHIFKPTVTVQYPEERIELGPEFRGRPVLVKEHEQERCVACGLCARACPPLAISMQASETSDIKERYPSVFEIDMLRCIYCGFCEDVCPEEAIVMSPEYDYVFVERKDAVMGKDRLLMDVSVLKPRLDFLARKRNKQFGKVYKFDNANNTHIVRDRQ